MKRLALLALFSAGSAIAATPDLPSKAHTVMMSDTVMSLVTAAAGATGRYRPALIDDFDVSNLSAPVATNRAMVAFDCAQPRKIAYIEGLKNRSKVSSAPPDWDVTRFAGTGRGTPDFAALPYVALADWVRQPASRHGSVALPPVDALAGEVICGGVGDPVKEASIAARLRSTGGFEGIGELTCTGNLPGQTGPGITMLLRYARRAGAFQLDGQWMSKPVFADQSISAVRDGVMISLNDTTRDLVLGVGPTFVKGKCTVGIAAPLPKP